MQTRKFPCELRAPIPRSRASQDRSETQIACPPNETDLLRPRAQEDGARACRKPDRRERPPLKRSESFAVIARHSSPCSPATTARDEKSCPVECGNHSSAHVRHGSSRRLAGSLTR